MLDRINQNMKTKQAARPNPHDAFGGLGGGGFDGQYGRNPQVTIRLLVPLAAGNYGFADTATDDDMIGFGWRLEHPVWRFLACCCRCWY